MGNLTHPPITALEEIQEKLIPVKSAFEAVVKEYGIVEGITIEVYGGKVKAVFDIEKLR